MSPSGSSARRASRFFSSRELMRMVSGILILGIVGMMYVQTRKSAAWTSIASEDEAQESNSPQAPWQERLVPNAGHADQEQIQGLRKDLLAITDNAPLAAEEMAAYWRMFRWAYAIPGEELRKQARTDLLFTHLFQNAEKYRGELVDVRVHVRRLAQHEAPKNSAEVGTVYEAWGPTEDSQTFPYCLAFADLPPGMKIEASPFFDARFVGFFLKKLAYEDATGAKRSAPLLIGRVVYDTRIAIQALPSKSWLTTPWIVGLCMSFIAVIVFVQLWARTAPRRPPLPSNDDATVESFLGELEGKTPFPQNSPTSQPPD